ncbi:MAG: arsenate reductase [Quisquiliibacterium sp.]
MQAPALANIYGIENCDQVRRARAWLRDHAIEYSFHDYRKHGLEAALLERWLRHLPWDVLLNRRGLAWRKLSAQDRARIVDKASAMEAMLAEPLLIKRPVIEAGDRLLVGFSDVVLNSTFEASTS